MILSDMHLRKKLTHEKIKYTTILVCFYMTMTKYIDDFIINLSNNNDYTNIMIIVNQLTKMRHMIFLKLLNVIKIAEVFI